MPASFEAPEFLVGEVFDHRAGAGIAAEEVLADEGAGLGFVGLEVAVWCGVHQVEECAVGVGGEQWVPFPAPYDFDHVPARAAKERLQLLDDLAVTADRSVEALQVAVHHEGQVVQPFARRDPDRAEGLRFIHLAVAEERPYALTTGVADSPCVQIAVEPSLVDGIERTESHRDRGELPEGRHQPRVRVGRQAPTRASVRQLLPEPVQLILRQAPFQEGPRIDARRSMSLEEDLVATALGVVAAEEVIEPHLVQRRRGRVGGDVSTYADPRTLGTMHHDRRIPPDVGADPPFDPLVTRKRRFQFRRDRVDVVGARHA